jgi:hypothetical protein
VAAVFQLAAPVTRFVTVAAYVCEDEKNPMAKMQRESLRTGFNKEARDAIRSPLREMSFPAPM